MSLWRKINDSSTDAEVIAAAREAINDPDFPADLKPLVINHLNTVDHIFDDLRIEDDQ